MPVLATAHYYSRYEFEVSQRVPKVIMGRHQQRPMLLVAPDVPCAKNDDDDDREHSHSPGHHMPQRALSPLQGPNLCTRVFFLGSPGSLGIKLMGAGCCPLSCLLPVLLQPPCDAER